MISANFCYLTRQSKQLTIRNQCSCSSFSQLMTRLQKPPIGTADRSNVRLAGSVNPIRLRKCNELHKLSRRGRKDKGG